MRLTVFLLVVFAALPAATSQAQQSQAPPTGDDFRHHVIVVIDRSGSMMEGEEERRAALRNIITSDLQRLAFSEGVVLPNRALLSKRRGDYLSVVSFGLDQENPDYADFIQTKERGINYGFTYRQNYGNKVFDKLWQAINTDYYDENRRFFSKYYSVISTSLPMTVHRLRRQKPLVNRTFLIHVTDDQFNTQGNPRQSLNYVERIADPMGTKAVKQRYRTLASSYQLPRLSFSRQKNGVKLKVFELVSLDKTFSIESLVSTANTVTFERRPDGYTTNFEIEPEQNPIYQIEKIEATLFSGDQAVARDTFKNVTSERTLSMKVDRSRYGQPQDLKVRTRYWVHRADEAYGAHVLHPEGKPIQGAAGLMRTLPVQFEQHAQVFGLVTLQNWMYDAAGSLGITSQSAARLAWELATGAFAVLVVFLILAAIYSSVSTVRKPAVLVHS